MPKLTRRKLLAAVPPVVVAASGARAALGGDGVHGVDREPERLDEVLLEQAVVPDHLERHPLAAVGQRGAAIALVLDEP